MSSSVILTLKDILLNEKSVYTLDNLKNELGLTKDKSLIDFLLRLLKSEIEDVDLSKMSYDESIVEIIYQYIAAFITEDRECDIDYITLRLNMIKSYIINQFQAAESAQKSDNNSATRFITEFWNDINCINNEVIQLIKTSKRYNGCNGNYNILEDIVYNVKNLELLHEIGIKLPKLFLETNEDGELFFNNLVKHFASIIKTEETKPSEIIYYDTVINVFLNNSGLTGSKKIKDLISTSIDQLNHNKRMDKQDIKQRTIFLTHLRKKLMGEEEYVENQRELYSKYKANIVVPNINNDDVLLYFNSLSKDYNDFTDKQVITIDPFGSIDLDDGISLEKLKNNNYLLGIYIADVSNYVSFNSYDDIEALKRGSTVYFNDSVVLSMLPEDITINSCSLLPNYRRKVVAYFFEIEPDGNIKNCQFARGIIKTRASYHLSYFEADNLLNEGNTNNYLSHTLNDLHCIACQSTPNVSNEPDALNEMMGSHIIVDRFMTLANYQVAKEIKKMGKPFLYRTHKIMNRRAFLNANPTLSNLVDELNSKMETNIDKVVLTSNLSRANYSAMPLPHEQLGFDVYAHTTSPIRRYPDLINQRLLKLYLIDKNDNDKLNYQIEDILSEIANNLNSNQVTNNQYLYDYAHILKK